MALNSSGQISLGGPTAGQSIALELGQSGTAQISLDDAVVRTLGGVASGQISFNTFYGKSNAFTATISTNQQELNLATYATSVGWNGTSAATITISAGVYIWSDNTAVAGLTTGNFASGLTIINNGYIIGKGGKGGDVSTVGSAGGNAISLGCNTTITNNSGAYIAGGGGGGGNRGGGGAGGGAGGSNSPSIGGAGGAVGVAGSTGGGPVATGGAGGGAGGGGGSVYPPPPPPTTVGAGGGGGRILPGVEGSAGAGSSQGGTGGSGNAAGTGAGFGGGGGGWSASGGGTTYVGGAGGKAIALNGFTATQSGAGTTWGAVS
jgi:hypothetical protein